jgi:hypothetical protein
MLLEDIADAITPDGVPRVPGVDGSDGGADTEVFTLT